MFSEFVYLNETSLSIELCAKIIELYENENNKYNGVTLGGYNPNIKNTTDLNINPNCTKWQKVNKVLENELKQNVEQYMNNINEMVRKHDDQRYLNTKYCIISDKLVLQGEFMVQKYTQNEGKYIYHHDGRINYEKKCHRVLTYLWYLNDVEEGGETDFYGNQIKPTAGKLLLFPAVWCFPHRGKIPISSDKYIITGWLYATAE